MVFSRVHVPVIYLTSILCGYLSRFQLVAIINSAVINCRIQYLSMRVKKKKILGVELLEQRIYTFLIMLYYKTNENKHVDCDQVCPMPSFSRARYT